MTALVPTAHKPRKWGSQQSHWSACGKDRASGTGGKKETRSGHWEEYKGLTQGCCECKVLLHHITVQEPLSLIKDPPLLLGEINGHIFKRHTAMMRTIHYRTSFSPKLQVHPPTYSPPCSPISQFPHLREILGPGATDMHSVFISLQ